MKHVAGKNSNAKEIEMGPIKSEIKMFVMRDARVFAEGYRNINEYKLMIFTFDLLLCGSLKAI